MFSYFKDKLKKAVKSAEEEVEDTQQDEAVDEPHPQKPKDVEEEEILETQDEENAEENHEEQDTAEKEGFFSKVKQTLTTKELTQENFETLFWEIELILLENNIAQDVVDKVKQKMQEDLVGTRLKRGKLKEVLQKNIEETLKESLENIQTLDLVEEAKQHEAYKIILIGINGSGKTTTAAKLATLFKKHGKNPVLGAADTFRAAAIDQLQQHANNIGIPCIKHDYGTDPAAVAYDTVKHVEKQGGVALIDTAGRLHSNTNLMNQLKKIVDVTEPHRVIYVAESVAGNDAVKQAKTFSEHIDVDGIIMTKADADEKGGTILSASYITNKPVLYLGTGQNYEDLERFDLEQLLTKLFK